METSSISEGKTIAIISYITLFGFIIALILNNSKKNDFASFHIRQSLGLILVAVLFSFAINLIDVYIITWVIQAGLFVLWLLGLLAAIQGEKKCVPLFGEQFQEWFKGIG